MSRTVTPLNPSNASIHLWRALLVASCLMMRAQPAASADFTVAPPPPPTIVDITVRTNLLLYSTGTNAWNLQPQYSTNLGQTNWSALTVSSNLVANSTNELICGKPPGNNVFIRLKATLK